MKTTNAIGLAAYVKADKVRKDQMAPVYMRVKLNGKIKTFTTGVYVVPDRWETTRQFNVTRDPEEQEKRLKLSEIRTQLFAINEDHVRRGYIIDADKLVDIYFHPESALKVESHTLLQLFKIHNDKFLAKVSIGKRSKDSFIKFTTVQDHLRSFLKKEKITSDIELDKLNLPFMESFELYLRNNGVGNNTAMKYCQFFVSMIYTGIDNDWIKGNPFKKFEYEFEEKGTHYLNEQELQRIMEKKFKSDRLNVVRDVFLFSCFTSYAPIDAKRLTPSHIKLNIDGQRWIFTKRSKTGVDSNVPILPQVEYLIDKFSKHSSCIATGKLLPKITDKCVNEYLKEIGTLCEIPFELHYYVARHTFATLMISKGVSMESVSKMMGHKRLHQTQHYAKIVENKVGKEMNKVGPILQSEFNFDSNNSLRSSAI